MQYCMLGAAEKHLTHPPLVGWLLCSVPGVPVAALPPPLRWLGGRGGGFPRYRRLEAGKFLVVVAGRFRDSLS